jgi:hypothetical protein
MRIAGFFIAAEPAPHKGENNQRDTQNAKQRHGFCSHYWEWIYHWEWIYRTIVIRGDPTILRFRTIMRKCRRPKTSVAGRQSSPRSL